METVNPPMVDILIVEDNPADARLMKEVLSDNYIQTQLHFVRDGVEALDLLYQKDSFADTPRPDLIFLDLNLPRMDGREVLATIKTDDSLKQIPVIVMTSSKAEDDISKSYSLHANCYVTKPMNLDQYVNVVKALENFWFAVVKLPMKR